MEQGVTALDAILLVLSEGSFAFVEGSSVEEHNMRMDVQALQGRLDILSTPARRADLTVALLPLAVPRIVDLNGLSATADEVVLDRGMLQTLLAINGQRTVEELSHRRGLARTLGDLATLLDLGLIQLEAASAVPALRPAALVETASVVSGPSAAVGNGPIHAGGRS
jgi:hypothetical protein